MPPARSKKKSSRGWNFSAPRPKAGMLYCTMPGHSPYLFRSQLSFRSQWTCLYCQFRPQRPWLLRQASTASPKPSSPKVSDLNDDEDHTLKILSHPLGQLQPPQPGENSGIDPRPWSQRRSEFLNYDKHLKRREEL